jgi:signal transduction histidine kinase
MEMPVLVFAVAISVHAAIILLLLGKYLETGLPYVAWWTAGTTALAARAAVDMSLLATAPPVPLIAARSALLLAGAGCFLAGSVARDPRGRRIVTAGVLGFGCLLIAAVTLLLFAQRDIAAARLIVGLAGGAAFLLAAEGYRRAERTLDDAATRCIFAGVLLAGLNFLAWAPVERTPAVASASEVLGGACLLVFALGIELRSLQRARQLIVLSQISLLLQRAAALEEMLAEVLKRTGDLLQVHTGWVFLRGSGPTGFELRAAYHLPPNLERDGRALMHGGCRCLDLLASGQLGDPVNIVDCMRLERAGAAAQHASVPLVGASGPIGLMNLMLPSGRLFTQRELALLATVGGEVGLAIEKAHLLDELREKERVRGELIKRLLSAQEDEQRRIARELHDEAGQSLTALILHLEHLETRLADAGTPASREDLAQGRNLAETTLEEVRKLIYDLRPTILDDLGLSAAVRWYGHHHLEPRGIAVEYDFRLGDARLDPTVETTIFRIAQEALWNVVKHAAASHVRVSLAADNGRLALRVKDNGRGFPADRPVEKSPLSGGLGLGGMRERAELLGGRVEIASDPSSGTEVKAEVPLPPLS